MTGRTDAAPEATPAAGDPYLRDLWYLAMPAGALRRGKLRPLELLGEPVLLGRAADGAVFALRNLCPHRGIPLHYGRFDGHEVACGYHGWRFDTAGRCTAIPSLTPDQQRDLAGFGCGAYPCRESQGNVWVFFARGRGRPDEAALPPVPRLPDVGEAGPQVYIHERFPCDADHAAFGLMDPTHAAFVHTSAWWKKSARTLRLKEKRFEPAPLGWRMARHRLPPESRAYRLLGERVTTEITYSLPGLRVEHVQGARHAVVSLTAITPINARETAVHQCLYWTMPWLAPLRPLVRSLARRFLGQDKAVVVRQQEGLAYRPSLRLIDDADTQAKWFARCKREYQRAQAECRAFRNPVTARTLRWRS